MVSQWVLYELYTITWVVPIKQQLLKLVTSSITVMSCVPHLILSGPWYLVLNTYVGDIQIKTLSFS